MRRALRRAQANYDDAASTVRECGYVSCELPLSDVGVDIIRLILGIEPRRFYLANQLVEIACS